MGRPGMIHDAIGAAAILAALYTSPHWLAALAAATN